MNDNLQTKIRQLKKAQQKSASANVEVENLEREVYEMTCKSGVQISDHALVRYLERVACIDIDALKRQMLTDRDRYMVNIGATRIKKGDCHLVIKDGVVVTVLGAGE